VNGGLPLVLATAAALGPVGCHQAYDTSDGGGPTCVPQTATDGAVHYDCLGGSWLQCPGNVAPQTAACGEAPSPCMGCSDGVGFACSCDDGGVRQQDDASAVSWVCVGTEYTCQ
jgi:hypothetical protein